MNRCISLCIHVFAPFCMMSYVQPYVVQKFMYIYTHICTCMYVCVYTYIHTYAHKHTHSYHETGVGHSNTKMRDAAVQHLFRDLPDIPLGPPPPDAAENPAEIFLQQTSKRSVCTCQWYHAYLCVCVHTGTPDLYACLHIHLPACV